MNTVATKPTEAKAQREWILIDAENLVLGRLSAEVAKILRGKHKPIFTPHTDCGDNVIIINAEKIKLTGNKLTDKKYYWHTGYPGGIKETDPTKILAGNHPERVVEKAITRMMPKTRLGRAQLKKLHIYKGAEHPHAGQAPKTLDLAAKNRKNKRA